MKPRKTVSLPELLEEVNRRNRLSTCAPGVREGWNDILNTLLHTANAYAGFRYLGQSEVPEGHAPGIRIWQGNSKEFPDETRIKFFLHKAWQKTE